MSSDIELPGSRILQHTTGKASKHLQKNFKADEHGHWWIINALRLEAKDIDEVRCKSQERKLQISFVENTSCDENDDARSFKPIPNHAPAGLGAGAGPWEW